MWRHIVKSIVNYIVLFLNDNDFFIKNMHTVLYYKIYLCMHFNQNVRN